MSLISRGVKKLVRPLNYKRKFKYINKTKTLLIINIKFSCSNTLTKIIMESQTPVRAFKLTQV